LAAAIIGGTVWQLYRVEMKQHGLAQMASLCRARAEQGDANAERELGSMYYWGKGVPRDYAEAVRWYRKSAEQGDVRAQYDLSGMYYRGEGVPHDYSEAVFWCRKSAEQGNGRAQYGLGFAYYEGKAVPRDYPEAVNWYRKSATQGDTEAQESLGFMYYKGLGVSQDYAEALHWYRKAADAGYAKAQYDLGYMYSHAMGIQRDYSESTRWYSKAAAQGYKDAQCALRLKTCPGTWRKPDLLLAIVCSIFLLFNSRANILDREERATLITILLLLSSVALRLYGFPDFLFRWSVSGVNALYFAKHLLDGTCVGMLVFIAWPRTIKGLLGVCLILLVELNIDAVAHYDLMHLQPAFHLFGLGNGLLIGMSIPPSIILWRQHKKSHDERDNTAVADAPG
jgi:TPR repeat protein